MRRGPISLVVATVVILVFLRFRNPASDVTGEMSKLVLLEFEVFGKVQGKDQAAVTVSIGLSMSGILGEGFGHVSHRGPPRSIDK